MGPLRFELRSEDPQSPRMARLPYGPALLLLAHFIYLSCYGKFGSIELLNHELNPCRFSSMVWLRPYTIPRTGNMPLSLSAVVEQGIQVCSFRYHSDLFFILK